MMLTQHQQNMALDKCLLLTECLFYVLQACYILKRSKTHTAMFSVRVYGKIKREENIPLH